MLRSIGKVIDTLEKQIKLTTRTDIRSLCFFRVLFGLFTILFVWPSYSWIGYVPQAFFNPPILSITSLFSSFPSLHFFLAIDVGIFITVIALTIGFFTQVSTVLLLVLMLLAKSFQYSFGKIDHDILYLCVLFVMAFKDWGRFLSVDSLLRRNKRDFSVENVQSTPTDLALLGVLVAFGFLTAGFGKALNWVDFNLSTSGVLSWLYHGYFTEGKDKLLAPFAIQLESPWLWEIADLSGVVFELGFLVALFWRRTWYIWLTIACGFHLTNCLLLNISFDRHAIVYLAFVPWSYFAIINRICFRYPKALLVALSGFCAFAAVIKVASNSEAGILSSITNWAFGSPVKLQVSILLWLLLIFIFVVNLRHLLAKEQSRT